MIKYQLNIKLLSDTTFGRGDGVAGLIDQEVEHDPYGFPYLRGRTLKGLLSEECDNLIAVLLPEARQYWQRIASHLFGTPGSTIGTMASVHVGDGCLPKDLREAVAFQIKREEKQEQKLTAKDVLDSLTTICRQTAIAPESGTADRGSLRSFHVVLRQLDFQADLTFETKPTDEMLSLLAVGALALRHLGSGRNRGRGHILCTLHEKTGKEENTWQDVTERYALQFGKLKEQSA